MAKLSNFVILEVLRNIRDKHLDNLKVLVMGHLVVSFEEVFSGWPLKLSKRKDVGVEVIFGRLAVPWWKCS